MQTKSFLVICNITVGSDRDLNMVFGMYTAYFIGILVLSFVISGDPFFNRLSRDLSDAAAQLPRNEEKESNRCSLSSCAWTESKRPYKDDLYEKISNNRAFIGSRKMFGIQPYDKLCSCIVIKGSDTGMLVSVTIILSQHLNSPLSCFMLPNRRITYLT